MRSHFFLEKWIGFSNTSPKCSSSYPATAIVPQVAPTLQRRRLGIWAARAAGQRSKAMNNGDVTGLILRKLHRTHGFTTITIYQIYPNIRLSNKIVFFSFWKGGEQTNGSRAICMPCVFSLLGLLGLGIVAIIRGKEMLHHYNAWTYLTKASPNYPPIKESWGFANILMWEMPFQYIPRLLPLKTQQWARSLCTSGLWSLNHLHANYMVIQHSYGNHHS